MIKAGRGSVLLFVCRTETAAGSFLRQFVSYDFLLKILFSRRILMITMMMTMKIEPHPMPISIRDSFQLAGLAGISAARRIILNKFMPNTSLSKVKHKAHDQATGDNRGDLAGNIDADGVH